jgi:hypothetical protein
MSDIIDINVGETIEEVTINVTDNLITVNINKVTGGGGGTQTLAQTLDLGNTTGGENISISNGDAIILDNGSMLKKGTIDAGNGGSKGISQICGVGYEHKWEAGRLYIMNDGGTTIREVSHNFTNVPTATDDVTKGFVQNTRWILDNGDVYLCTDPTEDAAVWEVVNTGTTPTLQEVLDNNHDLIDGNNFQGTGAGLDNTGNDVNAFGNNAGNGNTFNNVNLFGTNANADENSQTVLSKNGTIMARISTFELTDTRNYKLPDAEGTFALLSDIPAAQVNSDWNATSGVEEILNKPTIPAEQIQSDWTQANTSALDYIKNKPTIGSGTVTSVGLTMPSAFSVTNSPITSSGDIAVTGAGLVSQYVRGDGTLANFPNSTGGGSSVNYYLNGSVSQGTFGGDTYYEMSKTPILGAGTNFTRTNGQGNGYIASFITDAGDPSFLNIPGGNWNLEFYFQSSATGGSPQFYGEIYKVSATNVFTLVASGSANPEGITNGTTVDQYFTSIPVPQTSLLITDRLAIRIYVITSGRTITLHTENGNLCEVLTTFTTGLTALNGLTKQVQNLAVGTSGTDFAISSSTDTHTFNLPTASASNRGALSSTDWTTFNNKQNSLSYTPYKNIQTSQTVHTGTTSETLIFTALIPAGAFNSTDIIRVLFGANKTTALGSFSLRLRVNTVNNIATAPTIGLMTASASGQALIMQRNYNLNGGNLYGLNFVTGNLTDIVASGAGLNSTTLNPANLFYIFGTITLSNTSDTIIGNMFSIQN